MNVKHVTKNDFDKEISGSSLPVLVDFCPCGPAYAEPST